MEAVKAGRHEEGRGIVDRAERERRLGIFISLDHREDRAEDDRRPQTLLEAVAVAVDQRMMRPGDRRARTEQDHRVRSEEHTYELQSLMRISYAVFCLKKKK